MNPSLKSASMLLEIQIIVTFYHKNQLHKELLNTLLKKKINYKQQEYKNAQKPKRSLLKTLSTFEIFPSSKATFLARYVLLATI